MVADPGRSLDARRERTSLVALLLSMWGPLATGIAVALSQSTTQLADFVRRSVELVALATSYAVFRHLRRKPDVKPERAALLERRAAMAVATALTVSGAVMLVLVASRWDTFVPGGDVRLGVAIATLGLAFNSAFWRRYAGLARERPGPLIDAQRRLYRAKAAVDVGVLAALATVMFAPETEAARWVDLGGSLLVALYLLLSAQRSVKDALERRE